MHQIHELQPNERHHSHLYKSVNWRSVGVSLAPFALAISATFASSATPALADSGEQKMATLDEVIVTARRREEMLQDVPIAITAMSCSVSLKPCCACLVTQD